MYYKDKWGLFMNFEQIKGELENLIKDVEVVSFDIFDTLIKRVVNTPETIFDLIGERYNLDDFRDFRMKNQNLASQKVSQEFNYPHADINQIYEYIAKKEKNKYDWEKIKVAEIQMEYDAAVVNPEIMEIYKLARNLGKKIIAVSDMYLCREDIEKMLIKCGYNDLDQIYISSEVKKTKYQGDIYKYVAFKEKKEPEQIIHIGDNYASDVQNARRAGWKAYLYEKEQFQVSFFGENMSKVDLGICNSLIYNRNKFWYNLGMAIGGPLYMGLFLWTRQQLKKYDYEKIYFMARDGYNLWKIYQNYTKENVQYLYVSRRSMLLAGIDKLDEEAMNLLPPYTLGQTVREVLEYIDVLDVCGNSIQEVGINSLEERINDSSMVARVKKIYSINETAFLHKCEKERYEIEEYFQRMGLLDTNSILFDCGWNGSSQYLLDRILKLIEYRGKNRFLYAGILNTPKSKKQLSGKMYDAYLFDRNNNFDIQQIFLHAIVIAELFFGAPEQSTIKYQEGTPVLEPNIVSQNLKKSICEGIIDYVGQGWEFVKKYEINITIKNAVSSLQRLMLEPSEEEAINIGNLENVDGFVTQKDQKKYVAKLDYDTYQRNPYVEIYWLEGLLKRSDVDERLKKELKIKYKNDITIRKNSMMKNKYYKVKDAIQKYGIITSAYLYFNARKKNESLYEKWIAQNENEITTEILQYEPMFSIVVPVYNVEENQLIDCIESIKNQTYRNWELCLVDDCSTWDCVRKVLKSYEKDKQIYVKYRTENGHISKATNDGIKMTKGEFIVFCDCDDIISKNALYEFALKLNENKNYDFIYSDEDKLSEDGKQRHTPFFKPDWSPDTFMSLMYTNHLAVYRKSIVLKTGGLRSEYNGAQDYDFTLRFMELTSNKNVGHIPKILYHWRERKESIASDMKSKPYALNAVKRAKEQALLRRKINGEVQFVKDMYQYRIVYHAKQNPLVSIIIPSKDNTAMLFQCIDSILQVTEYSNYEIVLVDNGSTVENKNKIEKYIEDKNVAYIYKPQKFNFSAMCNEGARNANGEFLLFLNDDTKVINSNWLNILVGHASLDYVGAVGAKLLYPNSDTIQHLGIHNLKIGPSHALMGFSDRDIYYFGRNRMEYNYLAVTAACMLVNKDKFFEVKGFDENLAIAYNDVDLCFKLYENGYYNVVRNDVILYHYESVSRGSDDIDIEKKKRLLDEKEKLYKNHSQLLEKDPFYNINLTGEKVNYEIGIEQEKNNITEKSIATRMSTKRNSIVIIDEALIIGTHMRISGWYFTHSPLIDNLRKVNVLIKSADKLISISTDKVYRPDVALALNKKLFLSGFSCDVEIKNIPKGIYMVGIDFGNKVFKRCIWTSQKINLIN